MLKRPSRIAHGVAALSSFCLSVTAATDSWKLTPLGTLPGREASSVALAVSSEGEVVVGFAEVAVGHAYSRRAFRWTAESGLTDLGTLGLLTPDVARSSATAVSADGRVVVGDSDWRAFRWTPGTGMVQVGSAQLAPAATSADGEVIVGYEAGIRIYGFRWSAAGGYQRLETGNGLNAISADGRVAVGSAYAPGKGMTAALWDESTSLLYLGALTDCSASYWSEATAISADGRIVVGNSSVASPDCQFFDESVVPFVWTRDQGMRPLVAGLAPGWSRPNGVTLDGRMVVGEEGSKGWIWSDGIGLETLEAFLDRHGADRSAWREFVTVKAVTPDGRHFVGAGINLAGQQQAFLARRIQVGPALRVQRAANEIELAWEGTGWGLSVAPALGGPWSPQAGASPVRVKIEPGGSRYFRLSQP